MRKRNFHIVGEPLSTLKKGNLPFLQQRTWLVLRSRELFGYYCDVAFAPNPAAKHVLIYGQGRSGTTLLESLLCSTGYYQGMGEPIITKTREVISPVRYVRGLGRCAKNNVVAHVKISQLTRDRQHPIEPRRLLNELYADGWTIVYLLRRNLAEQVVSECIALKRGSYHKTNDLPERTRIRIEPEDFIRRYERRLKYCEMDRNIVKAVPHISLEYERDLLDQRKHQETINRILDALDLRRRSISTELRRIVPKDPQHYLENFEEIKSEMEKRDLFWPAMYNPN